MAKLTSDQREDMKSSEFALPGGRFPVNDANHARAALSGASRAYDAGNISSGQKAQIDAKADTKLGHPRQHSLAVASAETLHRAGYISTAHRDKIKAHAGKKLDAHKEAKAQVYGSMAPVVDSDGDGN